MYVQWTKVNRTSPDAENAQRQSGSKKFNVIIYLTPAFGEFHLISSPTEDGSYVHVGSDGLRAENGSTVSPLYLMCRWSGVHSRTAPRSEVLASLAHNTDSIKCRNFIFFGGQWEMSGVRQTQLQNINRPPCTDNPKMFERTALRTLFQRLIAYASEWHIVNEWIDKRCCQWLRNLAFHFVIQLNNLHLVHCHQWCVVHCTLQCINNKQNCNYKFNGILCWIMFARKIMSTTLMNLFESLRY